MSPDEIETLNQQIAAMAEAGLPLDRGLEMMANDMPRGEFRSIARQLVTDLRSGKTLDQALQQTDLPPFYPALVRAGVRTGQLPQTLQTISRHVRFVSEVRSSIISALIYPTLLLIGCTVLFGLTTFMILPKFQGIFNDFGLAMPLITRLVLSLGHYPVLILASCVLLLLPLLVLVWGSRYSPFGRFTMTRLLAHIPLLGTAVRASRLSAFTSLLAVLVEHDVPLPEAFRLAGEASPDAIMAQQAGFIATDLENGANLGIALTDRGLVPDWVAWMTTRGTRTQTLHAALNEVAELYRKQVESRTAIFRGVMPSFIVIILGGGMATLYLIAIMVPLLTLIEGLSK